MHRLIRFLPLVALLVLAGCGGANGSESAPAEDGTAQRSVRVETLILEPTTFEDVIELTGSVEATNDAMLSAQSAGTVQYLAPLGRQLGRGAVVARLDQGLVRAALQQAEAQLAAAQAQFELAEDNYRRQEPLYQDSVISALEFQSVRAQRNQARAGVQQAQAGVAQVREQLQNTVVTAPFAGTVESHAVEQGEQVAPGVPVARIVDTRRVKVAVGVPERYAGDIAVGTPVVLEFQAYGGQPRRGVVTFAGSAINPANRTFPVEIEVDNSDGKLKPEMIAKVKITRARLDDVLVVPRAAVLRDEEGTTVFVVARDAAGLAAERRTILTGAAYAGRLVIEEGLDAGEEVIVLGQTNVTDNDRVEVVEQYRALDAAGVPFRTE